MSRCILTPEAQDDLRGIRAYLVAEAGPRVARYVIGAFVNAFRSLAKMPGQGRRREDLTSDETLLFWPVFSYLIVYRRESKVTAVVAILHGSRDVRSVLHQRQSQ